jgi:hypothetical protein
MPRRNEPVLAVPIAARLLLGATPVGRVVQAGRSFSSWNEQGRRPAWSIVSSRS